MNSMRERRERLKKLEERQQKYIELGDEDKKKWFFEFEQLKRGIFLLNVLLGNECVAPNLIDYIKNGAEAYEYLSAWVTTNMDKFIERRYYPPMDGLRIDKLTPDPFEVYGFLSYKNEYHIYSEIIDAKIKTIVSGDPYPILKFLADFNCLESYWDVVKRKHSFITKRKIDGKVVGLYIINFNLGF